jgi:hypothetical protein
VSCLDLLENACDRSLRSFPRSLSSKCFLECFAAKGLGTCMNHSLRPTPDLSQVSEVMKWSLNTPRVRRGSLLICTMKTSESQYSKGVRSPHHGLASRILFR